MSTRNKKTIPIRYKIYLIRTPEGAIEVYKQKKQRMIRMTEQANYTCSNKASKT